MSSYNKCKQIKRENILKKIILKSIILMIATFGFFIMSSSDAMAIGRDPGYNKQDPRVEMARNLERAYLYPMYSTAAKASFVMEESGYVDGMSAFQYAKGNPLKYLDPTGLAAECDAQAKLELKSCNDRYEYGSKQFICCRDNVNIRKASCNNINREVKKCAAKRKKTYEGVDDHIDREKKNLKKIYDARIARIKRRGDQLSANCNDHWLGGLGQLACEEYWDGVTGASVSRERAAHALAIGLLEGVRIAGKLDADNAYDNCVDRATTKYKPVGIKDCDECD